MRGPPVVGRAILRCVVPASDLECVCGDLLEEYRTIQCEALGARGAGWWYVSQAVRSAAPFLLLRVRRGELVAEVALAQLVVIGALVALDGFWGVVLAQVPLRAAVITPASGAASVVAAALCAAAAGYANGAWAAGVRRASPFALSVFVLAAAHVVGPIIGTQPFVGVSELAAGLSAGVLTGGWLASKHHQVPAAGRRT